jgi:hypothetical protein
MISSLTNFGEHFISISYANNHNVSSTVGVFKEILYYYIHRNEKDRKGFFPSSERVERIENLYNSIQPKKEHYDFAEKVIEWVNTLGTSRNEYQVNLYQYFQAYKNNSVPDSKLGWVASAVSAYYKAHKEEKKAVETSSNESNYIGEVGKRIAVKGTVITMRIMDYNVPIEMLKKTFMIKIQDENGNILCAFSQAKLEGIQEGDLVEVKASVKKHEVFQNIKQTRITRINVKKIKKED